MGSHSHSAYQRHNMLQMHSAMYVTMKSYNTKCVILKTSYYIFIVATLHRSSAWEYVPWCSNCHSVLEMIYNLFPKSITENGICWLLRLLYNDISQFTGWCLNFNSDCTQIGSIFRNGCYFGIAYMANIINHNAQAVGWLCFCHPVERKMWSDIPICMHFSIHWYLYSWTIPRGIKT